MVSSYGMAVTNPLLISCSRLLGRSRSSGGFLVHSSLHHEDHELSFSIQKTRQDPVMIFRRFMDKDGHFEASLSEDLQGMLSLYEASHHDMGEEILCKAKDFSTKHLKSSINHIVLDAKKKIEHSLQHPIHTSLQRYNARNYICQYKGEHGMSKVLKELAIMDFNKVQSLHKSEYLEVLRWWKKLELSKQPCIFRDQPMKWFMWSLLPDPQFSKHRIECTKVIAFIYVIDDIFDVLGSLEELVLFTEAIGMWDSSPMDSLPSYMKICYNTLYNMTNEIANFIMREHGWNPIDSLKKSWESLFKAFLVEARWFTLGFTPTANEYLENGVISSGAHVVLTHLYFLLGDKVNKETNTALLNDNTPQLFSEI